MRYDHLAVKVDLETYEEIERRLKAADYPFNETHHGYCMSLYVTSPDEMTIEFAYDAPNTERSSTSVRRPTRIENCANGWPAIARPTTAGNAEAALSIRNHSSWIWV